MLIQVLARVTKFAWFDDTSHQEITDNVAKFLEVCFFWGGGRGEEG